VCGSEAKFVSNDYTNSNTDPNNTYEEIYFHDTNEENFNDSIHAK